MPDIYAQSQGIGPEDLIKKPIGKIPFVGPAAAGAADIIMNPKSNLPSLFGGKAAEGIGMAGSKERGFQGEVESNIRSKIETPALDQAGFIAVARATGAFSDISDDGILEWVKKYAAEHKMTVQDIYHYGKEAMVMAPRLNIDSRQALELFTAIASKMFVIQGGPGASIAIMNDIAQIINQSKISMIGRATYTAIVTGDTTSLGAVVDTLMLRGMTDPEARTLSTNLNNLVAFCVSPSPEMMASLHNSVQRSIYREQQRFILYHHTYNFLLAFFADIADKTTESIKGFIKDPSKLLEVADVDTAKWFDWIAEIGKAYNTGAEISAGAFGALPALGVPGEQKAPDIGLMPRSENKKEIRTAQAPPAPTPKMTSTTQPGAAAGEARSLGIPYKMSGSEAFSRMKTIDQDLQRLIPTIPDFEKILEDNYQNITQRINDLKSAINLADATRATVVGRAGERSPLAADIFNLTETGATMALSIQQVKELITELGEMLPNYEKILGSYRQAVMKITNTFEKKTLYYTKNFGLDKENAALFSQMTTATIQAFRIKLQKYEMTANTLWIYIKIIRQIIPDQWRATLLEQQFVQLFNQYNEQIEMDYPGIKILTSGVNNNLRIMASRISSIYGKISRILSSSAFSTQAQIGREKTSPSVNINILRYNYMMRATSWWNVVLRLQLIMMGKGTTAKTENKIYRDAKRKRKILIKYKNDIDKNAITEDTQERYQEYYGTEEQTGELPYGSKDESTNEWVQTLTHDPSPVIIKKKMRAKLS